MNYPFIPSHILPFIKQAKGSKIIYDTHTHTHTHTQKWHTNRPINLEQIVCIYTRRLGSDLQIPFHYHKISSPSLVSSRRGRMAVEMFSWPSLHERMGHVGIELGAACMPSGLASDRATACVTKKKKKKKRKKKKKKKKKRNIRK